MPKNALSDILNWQNKKIKQPEKVSHLCLDDHQFEKGGLESVGELLNVCSQIVLKCFFGTIWTT